MGALTVREHSSGISGGAMVLFAHRIRICTWTREESFAIVSSGNSLAAPLFFTKVEMSRVASHRKLSLTASPQGLLEHPRQERDPLSGEGAQDPMSSQRALFTWCGSLSEQMPALEKALGSVPSTVKAQTAKNLLGC